MDGAVIHEPIIEHVPADVRAAELWLRNRLSANPRPQGDVGNEGKSGLKLQRLECLMTLHVEQEARG